MVESEVAIAQVGSGVYTIKESEHREQGGNKILGCLLHEVEKWDRNRREGQIKASYQKTLTEYDGVVELGVI